MDTKPKNLTCSFCLHGTYGRQWVNKGKGFGVCDECVKSYHIDHDAEVGETEECYGIRGYHWDLTKEEELKDMEMDHETLTANGQKIIDLLNLKVNKLGRVSTSYGDKTPRGLYMTMKTFMKEIDN